MKIVNKQEFYALPYGTLYSKYAPMNFYGLKIKGDTIYGFSNEPIDFYYEDLIGNVEFDDSNELVGILDKAEKQKTSFPLEYNCSFRDGMFEQEESFAIYELTDIYQFIDKLKSLI